MGRVYPFMLLHTALALYWRMAHGMTGMPAAQRGAVIIKNRPRPRGNIPLVESTSLVEFARNFSQKARY